MRRNEIPPHYFWRGMCSSGWFVFVLPLLFPITFLRSRTNTCANVSIIVAGSGYVNRHSSLLQAHASLISIDICHASHHHHRQTIVSRLYVFRSNQDSKRAGRARTIRNISLLVCAGFGPAPPNRSNRAEDDGDVVGSRRTSFPLPSAAVFGSKSKETFPLASSRKLTLPLLSVLFPSTTSSTVRFDSLPLLCWLGQNTKETDRADAIILPSVIANILNLFVVRQHAPPLQPQLQHLR